MAWVELRGPMDCSVYTNAKWDELLQRLGPDPLNGDDPERAFEKIAKSKKSIGILLMEQDVFAGIGNIYRAELLFRARQSPFTAGKDVPEGGAEEDLEGCRAADAGGDGRSPDCDDAGEGPHGEGSAGGE